MNIVRKIILFFTLIIIIALNSPVSAQPLEQAMAAEAKDFYCIWKQNYVVRINDSMSRVINPQENNMTVSEGIGYGLLFSAAANDEETFDRLWQYAKQYLDENGLMHWKINALGRVIGYGSAADADQDIAYALLIADKKWPQKHYSKAAQTMIKAIKTKEVLQNGVLLPGDRWKDNAPINPSYIALGYYSEFEFATKDSSWRKISDSNLKFIEKIANKYTGFVPDWINENGTTIAGKNIFGYDALRMPIRLFHFYKKSGNNIARDILQREYNFIEQQGANHLYAGYDSNGKPVVAYMDTSYLTAFACLSYLYPDTPFGDEVIDRWFTEPTTDYYSSSLKMWVLFIISDQLN